MYAPENRLILHPAHRITKVEDKNYSIFVLIALNRFKEKKLVAIRVSIKVKGPLRTFNAALNLLNSSMIE